MAFKVVALISGGKDSFFSMLHCVENGHEIVALANLYPRAAAGDGGSEDIDSFMYQTVGHGVIPLYEQALELPLFRQQIVGSAVNTDKGYAAPMPIPMVSQGTPAETRDETESLVPLLKQVKAAIPSTNAVCTGAILSDYQRTRVESVAVRLGLVPLSYLWQYPNLPPYVPISLLEDMARAGLDARIIKAASGGLDERHLWLNVADERSIATLGLAMRRYGGLQNGAVLGEGGEFETLALCGPSPLWKKRVTVREEDRIVVSNGGGSVALRIAKATVVDLETEQDVRPATANVRIPLLYDTEFALLLHRMETSSIIHPTTRTVSSREDDKTTQSPILLPTGAALMASNLTGVQGGVKPEEQMTCILTTLQALLTAAQYTVGHIVFVKIILRSMADFAAINTVYGHIFRKANPPARVTVACSESLEDDVQVMASFHVNAKPSKDALHVQSRSYWAPANIGPYSQAKSVVRRARSGYVRLVYISGQIPLVPSSMELHSGSFVMSAVLALQHLWRVGRAMGVAKWRFPVAYVTASTKEELSERVEIASRVWHFGRDTEDVIKQEIDSEDDEDIAETSLRQSWASSVPIGNDTLGRPGSLSYWEENQTARNDIIPQSCTVVEVSELPRASSIEWSAIGVSSISGLSNDLEFEIGGIDLAEKSEDLQRIQYANGGQHDIYCASPVPATLLDQKIAVVMPAKSVWFDRTEYFAVVHRWHV